MTKQDELPAFAMARFNPETEQTGIFLNIAENYICNP
jgi:hypothetical protein